MRYGFNYGLQYRPNALHPSLRKRGRGDFRFIKRAFWRRRLTRALGYALLSILLLAPLKASLAQTPAKVAVAYSAVSPIFAGVWMAKETGAFEKQGLKADLVYISSGSITVQAMVGGNLDMSVAASNAVVSSILRVLHWLPWAASPTGRP